MLHPHPYLTIHPLPTPSRRIPPHITDNQRVKSRYNTLSEKIFWKFFDPNTNPFSKKKISGKKLKNFSFFRIFYSMSKKFDLIDHDRVLELYKKSYDIPLI